MQSNSNLDYKVNLLPYRRMREVANGKRYVIFLSFFGVIAFALVIAVYFFFALRLTIQETRNNYLESQITVVQSQIKEIEKLKEDIAQLLARKQVVETLQVNRGRTISLLNFLVDTPEGVFFSNIKQNGENLDIVGFAKTQEHVASLLQKIQQSGILTDARLVEAVSSNVQGDKMSQFKINAKFVRLVEQKDEPKSDVADKKKKRTARAEK